MTKRRVVVTGLGIISPMGLDIASAWQAVINGVSPISTLTELDDQYPVSDYRCQIAGVVKDFDPSLYLSPKESRKLDTFVQYGVAASKQAIQDSGLTADMLNSPRAGIAIGSGIGGIVGIEKNYFAYMKKGPRGISPYFIPGSIINMVSGVVAMNHGCQGPNISIVSACTTATHNIGYAARNIQHGEADIMIVGGAERAACALGMGGFGALRALTSRNDAPTKASRPWDKDRDGFVLSDGAGILVLEEYEHAKKRGANIYAEIKGFGMSCDAYHMTLPEETGKGASAAMVNAMQDANANPSDIDYINAHATSTPAGDEIEVRAIKRAFADDVNTVAVSSTKSVTGHLLGAAGAVEAIFSILAIRDNIIPPTINLDNPSEGCDINLTPNTAQEQPVKTALANSFGFGGTNGTLIFTEMD